MKNSTDKNTPKKDIAIIRKGELDIYNTGKKKEKTESVPIIGDRHWYDQEWHHIYDKKNWYINEGNNCRKISQHLKEKMVQTLTNMNDNILDRAWLNMPMFLEHPNKREMEMMYGKRNSDSVKKEHLAELQFYRGAWGKAYKTLAGINRKEKMMNEEEVNRLFPSEEMTRDKFILSNEIINAEQRLITIKEIQEAIKSLPNGKACGLSGGHYEVLKSIASLKKGLESIARTCDYIIKHPAHVHPQIYTSRCIGISKKDGGTRPLCIQESITKILHKVIAKKLESVITEGLEETQKCLSTKEGQIEAWTRVLENYNNKDVRNFIIVFDFTNAFGTVSRIHIIKRLQEKKIPMEYINYIHTMLARQQIVYKDEKGEQKWKRITRGVPQGEPLSLAIDSMLQKFNEKEYITVTAYADDVVFVIKGEDKIQTTIKEFKREAAERGLRINMSKTNIGYTRIEGSTLKWLEKKGIKASNINEKMIEYVGLPITLNPKIKEKFVKQKTMAFINDTKVLWLKKVPIQMKYHLQELCLNSKLTYLYRAVEVNDGKEWMEES